MSKTDEMRPWMDSLWRAENYDLQQASRCAFQKAIREGVVKRGPCAVCGNPKSEGHHEDYAHPLDVMWLCRIHHSRRHRDRDFLVEEAGEPNPFPDGEAT